MSVNRRNRLAVALVCFLTSLTPAWSQNAPSPAPQQSQGGAKPAEQAKPAQEPSKANPFENVEAAPATGKPQQPGQPQLEAPKPAAPEAVPAGNVIEDIQFKGSRRVSPEMLRGIIQSRKGDVYTDEAIHRDFMLLWNSGRFDDIRIETEPGKTGIIVRFVITERRVIRSITYSKGMKSVSVSEVLDRFKERKVGLVTESQYDPNKVQHAAVVLKEFLAERGRQYATVEPEIRQIPPSSLEITFNVNEGPKVKVGKIDIEGNDAHQRPRNYSRHEESASHRRSVLHLF